jgi:two-component system NtrC family sensor kinase
VSLGHRLEELGVGVDLDLLPELPAVPMDSARIQQVVTNLVLNAAEAHPKSGCVRIVTRLDAGAGVAVLSVADDGQGIAPEHLTRIFEPFFTTKEVGQGTGLGLAVVYGIVEAHGGRIDVESALGQGTTFTVRLNLAEPGSVKP